jgi:hypothetical protein
MTLDDFRNSLAAPEPPAGLAVALAGLWWDAKRDWTRAHESAQQDEGMEGRGCMPTCTGRKAIMATQRSGTDVQASPSVESR